MLRWIKNGGWILVLALIIFLSFCVFAMTYSKSHKPPKIYSPRIGLGGYSGSIGIMSLSVSDIDVDYAISQPIPPIDSEPSELDETPLPPINQEDNAAESEPENESENEIPDDNTEHDENEIPDDDIGGLVTPDTEILEDDTSDISDSSVITYDAPDYSELLNETLYTLREMRNTLGVILYLLTAIIAVQILYVVIFKPLYSHYMR